MKKTTAVTENRTAEVGENLVDNSVDFVDYLRFFIKKTTDGSKMMYNSKRMDVDK